MTGDRLREWLGAVSLLDVALTIGWVVGVAVALWRLGPLVRSGLAVLDRFHRIADDWMGRPEEKDASGAVVRKAEPGIVARVAAIEYHVQPNHGGSAYDALKAGQDEMREMLVGALSELGTLRRIAARQHPDDPDLT